MYKQLKKYKEERGKVRVALYTRCSSDEQKKNGYTIQDQLALLTDFADENELIVFKNYVDEGVSATLEIHKRKELAQMIEDAKEGHFDIILIKCIDRFFRSVEEYYACQKQLRKAGVTWLSIEEADLDPNDDDAAFKINIYLTMAEYEAKKTSKRIKFNNKMRIKNKQVVTGTKNFLFPWIVVGEKRNRQLAQNMEKAEMLYALLDYYETHQSKKKTLVWFNEKYDQNLPYNSLTNLLQDTLLYGEYKGEPDYVEPYITKDRFDKLQHIQKRNTRYHQKSGRIFIFAGMLVCRCCGRKMAGNFSTHKGKYENYSYRCNSNRRDGSCDNNQSTTERKIEKQLIDNLDQYIKNEIIRVESITAKKSPKVDYEKKINELKEEMERLNIMFRKRRISEEEYDEEYYSLEKALARIEIPDDKGELNIEALKEVLESDWKAIYNELNKENKRAFWRGIISEFTIDEDRKIVPESIIFF